MIDDVSMAGIILAVFVFGITVGKFVEKIERLIREKEDEEHRNAHKNDRRQYPDKIGTTVVLI